MWSLNDLIAVNERECQRRRRNEVKAGLLAQSFRKPVPPPGHMHGDAKKEANRQACREGVDD